MSIICVDYNADQSDRMTDRLIIVNGNQTTYTEKPLRSGFLQF